MHFLKLIRYKNLLFLVLIQVLIKYGLFDAYRLETTLTDFHFFLLLIATVCIAAGGYIINDIFDIRIDTINKTQKVIINNHISEKSAYNYYLVFTASGVFLGFYLSNHIGVPGFAALFILIGALLYIYATFLKGILLLGNLVISLLISSSILIVGLFELFPNISSQNILEYQEVFSILLKYAFFAFLLTLIREIVKDIEDVNGDKNDDLKTLPIVLGRKRAALFAFILAVITVMVILFYMYDSLYKKIVAMAYFLIFIIGPLLYFCVQLFSAEKKESFRKLSTLLKFIMLFGILTLLLYKFNFI